MPYPPKDYHICPSCGTEFGYDDAGRSHTALRTAWLKSGTPWWSPVSQPPEGWDPLAQVSNLLSTALWTMVFIPQERQENSQLFRMATAYQQQQSHQQQRVSALG